MIRRPDRGGDRRGLWGADAGSLPIALLLTMLGVSLSALLLPMVVTQVESTRGEIQRGTALHAAQAGLDVALGHVRAAAGSDGVGNLSALPCAPLTGAVGGDGGRYRVTVDYFAFDPRGRSESWIANNQLGCPATGPLPVLPRFALLRSHGTDRLTGDIATAPGRTVRGTYTILTTNENIAGGLIRVYKTATSTDLCLDAGTGSPTTGTNVRVRPCTDPPSDWQKFAYNQNLTLVLVASKTPANPLGMCLDAAPPHTTGRVVTFQPCASPNTAAQQQWSFNDSARLEGTSNGTTRNGFCFNVQNPNVSGSLIVLGACSGGYDNVRTFSPQAAVGAGAAGTPGSDQLVNYAQFGRCLDVTNQQVGWEHLIAWPCKQEPIASNVTWNQRWRTVATNAGDGSVRVVTDPPSGAYCLHSPLATGPGRYVTVTSCPGNGAPPHLRWRFSGATGSYETSYRVMDDAGLCLAPTDPAATPPDLFEHGERVSKLVVVTCSGSTLQKWNAPPNLQDSRPLKDLLEE